MLNNITKFEYHSLKDIHHDLWKKHYLSLRKIVNQLDIPFAVEGLTYTKVFKSGLGINIPLKTCDEFKTWAASNNAKISSFDEILYRPAIVNLNDLAQLSCENAYHLDIVTQDRLRLLPIHYIYNLDNSISNLCFFVKTPLYTNSLSKLQWLDMSQMINKIEKLIQINHPKLITDFTVKPIANTHINLCSSIPLYFQSLNKSEILCIIAIYHGNFEVKDIASILCRSVRTVQTLVQSLVKKFGFKNRYELYAEIYNNAQYIKYFYQRELDLKLPKSIMAAPSLV
ncbi:MAG: hypothetical protein EP298_10955 [Gammaproteobacteria bacterium]|nr:MAG: hypothetical protein EP298_10955 [Gammaproteobacteria bacterium]UTW41605.1 hypothetical protein KFE69_08805 [bacterium SCSIO 12844]